MQLVLRAPPALLVRELREPQVRLVRQELLVHKEKPDLKVLQGSKAPHVVKG